MIKQLKLAGVATSVFLMAAAGASAATVTDGPGGFNAGWATEVTYDNAAPRGTANNRHLGVNSLGATDSNFFELGWNSIADFTFGSIFQAPVNVVEVTFSAPSNPTSWIERVDLWVGMGVGAAFVGEYVTTISNQNAQEVTGGYTAHYAGGPWSVVRLIDNSPNPRNLATGGFDVDSVRVDPVPLPAAGFLLLAGLGGLAAMRRRKKS